MGWQIEKIQTVLGILPNDCLKEMAEDTTKRISNRTDDLSYVESQTRLINLIMDELSRR